MFFRSDSDEHDPGELSGSWKPVACLPKPEACFEASSHILCLSFSSLSSPHHLPRRLHRKRPPRSPSTSQPRPTSSSCVDADGSAPSSPFSWQPRLTLLSPLWLSRSFLAQGRWRSVQLTLPVSPMAYTHPPPLPVVRLTLDEDRKPLPVRDVSVAIRCYEARVGRSGIIASNILVEYSTVLWTKPADLEFEQLGEIEWPFRLVIPSKVDGCSAMSLPHYRVFWRVETGASCPLEIVSFDQNPDWLHSCQSCPTLWDWNANVQVLRPPSHSIRQSTSSAAPSPPFSSSPHAT
jgi:hypothetical protein